MPFADLVQRGRGEQSQSSQLSRFVLGMAVVHGTPSGHIHTHTVTAHTHRQTIHRDCDTETGEYLPSYDFS